MPRDDDSPASIDAMLHSLELIRADIISDVSALDGTVANGAELGRILGQLYAQLDTMAHIQQHTLRWILTMTPPSTGGII